MKKSKKLIWASAAIAAGVPLSSQAVQTNDVTKEIERLLCELQTTHGNIFTSPAKIDTLSDYVSQLIGENRNLDRSSDVLLRDLGSCLAEYELLLEQNQKLGGDNEKLGSRVGELQTKVNHYLTQIVQKDKAIRQERSRHQAEILNIGPEDAVLARNLIPRKSTRQQLSNMYAEADSLFDSSFDLRLKGQELSASADSLTGVIDTIETERDTVRINSDAFNAQADSLSHSRDKIRQQIIEKVASSFGLANQREEVTEPNNHYWEIASTLYKNPSLELRKGIGNLVFGAGLMLTSKDETSDLTDVSRDSSETRPGYLAIRTDATRNTSETYPLAATLSAGVDISDRFTVGGLANIVREDNESRKTREVERFLYGSRLDGGTDTLDKSTDNQTKTYLGVWAKANLGNGYGAQLKCYDTRNGSKVSVGVTKRFGDSRNSRGAKQ